MTQKCIKLYNSLKLTTFNRDCELDDAGALRDHKSPENIGYSKMKYEETFFGYHKALTRLGTNYMYLAWYETVDDTLSPSTRFYPCMKYMFI